MIKHSFRNINNPKFGSSMDDVTILDTGIAGLDSSTALTNCTVGCIMELASGWRYP